MIYYSVSAISNDNCNSQREVGSAETHCDGIIRGGYLQGRNPDHMHR